jgi:hypothetical protein
VRNTIENLLQELDLNDKFKFVEYSRLNFQYKHESVKNNKIYIIDIGGNIEDVVKFTAKPEYTLNQLINILKNNFKYVITLMDLQQYNSIEKYTVDKDKEINIITKQYKKLIAEYPNAVAYSVLNQKCETIDDIITTLSKGYPVYIYKSEENRNRPIDRIMPIEYGYITTLKEGD